MPGIERIYSEARSLLVDDRTETVNPVTYVRSLVAALALAAAPSLAFAQTTTWTIDPGHSSATFSVRHMVVANVKGEFAGPVGTAMYDPKDLVHASRRGDD